MRGGQKLPILPKSDQKKSEKSVKSDEKSDQK